MKDRNKICLKKQKTMFLKNGQFWGYTDTLKHCITEEKFTTKIRIIYDASARISSDAPNINICLHVGPSLLPYLRALLMKFRIPQKAMTADIKKAFLQVELSEVDWGATRFLKIKNVQEATDVERNIECHRFH